MDIKAFLLEKIKTINPNNITSNIKIHHREMYDYIIEYTKWNMHAKRYVERIYCILNDITERPVCNYCGGIVKFRTLEIGYNKHCDSRKCLQNSEYTKNKKKETCLKNWGTDHHMSSKEGYENYKDKLLAKHGYTNTFQSEATKEKIKNTCLEKFGYEIAAHSPVVKAKTKNTCLEKFGGNGPMCSIAVKEKSKNTCLEKYGVDSYNKTQASKDNYKKVCLEKYGVDNYSKSDLFKEQTINSKIVNGTLYWPGIGKNETQILNEVEQEIGYKLIRQYQVKNYFVDEYCKETNTVYEVYEKSHKYNVEYDTKRKNIIMEKLKCEFVVIEDNYGECK